MVKKALIPVTDGTEELEAVAIIDILRRADIEVTVASTTDSKQIHCSRGITLVADTLISDCLQETYDLVALPGGIPGAQNLRDSVELTTILKNQHREGRYYGAICASPAVILGHHGLLEGKKATCHPGFADQMKNRDQSQALVVIDGNCITSRGAGTAVDFALSLVEILMGRDSRQAVEDGLAMVKK